MKLFLYISFIAFTTSCTSQREIQQFNQETKSEEVGLPTQSSIDISNSAISSIGTVRESSKGCPFCIEVQIEPGVIKFFYPVNLEDEYKKEGTRLEFEYTLSRAMQPAGCAADNVVALFNIRKLR